MTVPEYAWILAFVMAFRESKEAAIVATLIPNATDNATSCKATSIMAWESGVSDRLPDNLQMVMIVQNIQIV